MDNILAISHVAATLMMTGIIWLVQLCHYPLFARVGESSFRSFHHGHTRRISLVVVPLMLVELVTALYLAVYPGKVAVGAAWIGLGLVLAIWAVTFLVSVPYHNRLTEGSNANVIEGLVRTNWLRTILWSARALLVCWILAGLISR